MPRDNPGFGDSGRTRRGFLADGAAIAAAGLAGGRLGRWAGSRAAQGLTPGHAAALRALGHSTLRHPDSLPNPALPAGVDTMPTIEHFVVLMLENHSYDNLLGMLGREAARGADGNRRRAAVTAGTARRLKPQRGHRSTRGRHPRGDGFTIGRDGLPTAANPYADGRVQHAFHMPTTCQLHGKPSQEWKQSHVQFNGGRNDGFVISDSGPVAMGYWTGEDLPFTYDLAAEFPIGDRWFSSCLAQTDPQRRYLIAATSSGMTDDIGAGPGNIVPDVSLGAPANGTIFDRLNQYGISWIDYNASFPTGTTCELYPINDAAANQKPIEQFFSDAAAGRLPSFSLLDPDYGNQSQEDPQNIVVGEAFLARAVRAVGRSPLWRKTLFILTYDEHGGYFDHVPPPAALAPDSIPPQVQPGESTYDGFARYGFRVPAVVVGPYAKRRYVSHRVYDHTSILAMLERKWNLPAMTYRDANANDLTDFLDLAALRARRPTFSELPRLAASGDKAATLACSKLGPGTIPPPGSISGRRRT